MSAATNDAKDANATENRVHNKATFSPDPKQVATMRRDAKIEAMKAAGVCAPKDLHAASEATMPTTARRVANLLARLLP